MRSSALNPDLPRWGRAARPAALLGAALLAGCTWDWPAYSECGNGVAEPGETCDGTDFGSGGGRCADLTAFAHGEIHCTSTCRLDTSDCHQCGNGELEGPEPCDGSNLDGRTCQGLGFDEGTLACRADCSQFDWSACVGCGDGVIRTGEACDDGNFVSGDGCDADCQVEPGWTCDGAEPSVCDTFCGDGIAAGEEFCDGGDLRGQTCLGLGFSGGDLGCQVDCTGFTTVGCGGPGCGNGVVEGTEVCDDGVAADGDGCSTGCQVEAGWSCDGASPTTCAPICGDGLIVGGEVCDGVSLGGQTCVVLGFDGGTLACSPGCEALRTGGCWTCGDGSCEAEKGETVAACNEDCGWEQIATGPDNTCAIKRDGSAWCWGANYDGQLGAGSPADMILRPVRVLGLPGLARQMSVGEDFVCAKLWDDTAWCWGRNLHGQVGVDTAGASVPAPTQVLGIPGILQVSAGDQHTCARDVTGAAWCWGNGDQGRLGVGTEESHAGPVQVTGLSDVVSITAGGSFSCAVLSGGTAKCWGDNYWGVLGTGNTTSSLTPVQVSGLTGADSILANGYTVCAIRDNGTAACWGSNGTGELGDGTQDNRYAPVDVLDLTGATSIDGGSVHTCASDGSGIAWCWGHDSDGQVGNGEEYLYAATSPVQVVDLTGVVQITAAFTHSLAIDSSGRAWGWGYGGFGVIGNGQNGGDFTSPIPTLEP